MLRRTAPGHDASISCLSDHVSVSGLEPEHDRSIGQPQKSMNQLGAPRNPQTGALINN
jgi:hypothetical protein